MLYFKWYAAGAVIATDSFIGALLITIFYLIVGGRAFFVAGFVL